MPSASIVTLAEQVGIHQMFKLTTAISTSNMMLLDAQERIKKYDSPLDILSEFCSQRLQFYVESRPRCVTALQDEILKFKNRIKFDNCAVIMYFFKTR
jgi:DNA topoisomerase-2